MFYCIGIDLTNQSEHNVNPVTGGLWLSDTAHHHVAIAVLFLVAGHQYRTNWGIGHSIKEILD